MTAFDHNDSANLEFGDIYVGPILIKDPYVPVQRPAR